MERYTREQILCGLRYWWSRRLSNDSPFDAETRLDEYMKADGSWDELDFSDVAYAIDRFFGIDSSVSGRWKHTLWVEWDGFLRGDPPITDAKDWEERWAPRLTFGALADFLRSRIQFIPLGPATVLGKPCAPAGAFRAIEMVAASIRKDVKPFAPSTAIRERFHGQAFRRFWERLRWMSEDRLPTLDDVGWTRVRRSLLSGWGALSAAILSGLLLALAALAKDVPLPLNAYAGLILLIVWAVIANGLREHWVTPLPSGIRTFGDMAEAMVEPSRIAD